MAMAAGKSAGKRARMTDNAFKPPTEVAIAMTLNETLTDEAGAVSRAGVPDLFCPGFDLDCGFMIDVITNVAVIWPAE